MTVRAPAPASESAGIAQPWQLPHEDPGPDLSVLVVDVGRRRAGQKLIAHTTDAAFTKHCAWPSVRDDMPIDAVAAPSELGAAIALGSVIEHDISWVAMPHGVDQFRVVDQLSLR